MDAGSNALAVRRRKVLGDKIYVQLKAESDDTDGGNTNICKSPEIHLGLPDRGVSRTVPYFEETLLEDRYRKVLLHCAVEEVDRA